MYNLLVAFSTSFDFISMYSPLFSLNVRVIRSLYHTTVANFTTPKTHSGLTPEEAATFDETPSKRSFYSGDSDLVKYYDRFLFLENSSSQRVTRFSGSLVSYDYKTGHYLGVWDKLYPQLMLSFIEVARGIRKPSWTFSDQYVELLRNNYRGYFSTFTGKSNLRLFGVEG